jgi:hypothetical protein
MSPDSLPVWSRAALWGALAGSGLLVGLIAAMITRPAHGSIARVMAFGAGALLGTASIQLTVSAQEHAGILRTTVVLPL